MNENKAINMQIPFTNIAITQLSAHQCITIPIVLQCKIILKIQLIENKEVTLFVQLNW